MEPILNAPVIVDLGKTSRKNVKQLRQGRGELLGDVQEAMQEFVSSLGEQAAGQQFIPVVLLYRRKAKKRKNDGLFPIFS